ncbi:MAG: smalltalk protein [Bacteroidaceae bacterium]|nr:smalltalk protein [Bacteroidaceae bacterium]
MNETEPKKENVWGTILKIVIAVASALAGVLGVTACVG